MPFLVPNMTPSPIVYGRHPSCQTQAETHSKQPYAYQHIQLHSAMHIEVLGSAWRCLRTSRGLYRVWTHIHGQTNMTTYGVRFCIWTSGPQALQTHRKASNNTLPCIFKHVKAFGGAWGPPEVHAGYELTSMARCT